MARWIKTSKKKVKRLHPAVQPFVANLRRNDPEVGAVLHEGVEGPARVIVVIGESKLVVEEGRVGTYSLHRSPLARLTGGWLGSEYWTVEEVLSGLGKRDVNVSTVWREYRAWRKRLERRR